MKRIYILLLMFSFFIGANAQMDIELQNLVASSTGTLRHRLAKKAQHIENDNSVVVIAQLEKGTRLQKDALEQIGVKVRSDYGHVAVLSVPISKLKTVAEMDGIEYLNTDHKSHVTNDSARIETQVDLLQSTVNGQQSTAYGKCFDGTGVLVGIVDAGIDFNHAAFRDENGNTRIKMAQIYDTNEGSEPADMSTIRRTYTSPEDIAMLKSDDGPMSHGSHTSCTAAGSPVTLQTPDSSTTTITGMAPKADLLLSSMYSAGGETYDSYCMDAIYNQIEYAKQVGKPIVINNSYGETSVFCDGKSAFSVFEESVAGPGKIMCFSAGNENNNMCCIEYTPTSDNDTIKTMLYDPSYFYKKGVKAYVVSEDETPIDVRLGVFHPLSIVNGGPTTTPWQYFSNEDSIYISEENAMTKGYETKHNNRYTVMILLPSGTADIQDDLGMISLTVVGKKDKKIRIVYPENMLYSFKDPDYLDGGGINSFGYHCESDSVIAVGSYCSREQVLTHKMNVGISSVPKHMPSHFSSYGELIDGKNIPDVLAPGEYLLSAFNTYDSSCIQNGEMVGSYLYGYSEQFGRKSYYGWMRGTSMSSPVTTGIIALWLQANPNLSVSDVRDIIRNTSEYCPETADYPKEALGYGYIKAANGLEYILSTYIPTSVEEISKSKVSEFQSNSDSFNLAGQKVGKDYKGIVITNGRKVLNR